MKTVLYSTVVVFAFVMTIFAVFVFFSPPEPAEAVTCQFFQYTGICKFGECVDVGASYNCGGAHLYYCDNLTHIDYFENGAKLHGDPTYGSTTCNPYYPYCYSSCAG